MRKRKDNQSQSEEKILDVSASMQGTLRFDDPVNLRISGKFEGTLDTKGTLMVGKEADIRANITGESISVAGRVSGNIKAAKNLTIESTASLSGDVETPVLAVSEGAVMNGQVRMSAQGGDEEGSRGDWMTTGQLAEYLEVDSTKVSEWVDADRLPATKEGGEWVFEKSKVDQWIAEGRVKG